MKKPYQIESWRIVEEMGAWRSRFSKATAFFSEVAHPRPSL
jgi:hypothetical protein